MKLRRIIMAVGLLAVGLTLTACDVYSGRTAISQGYVCCYFGFDGITLARGQLYDEKQNFDFITISQVFAPSHFRSYACDDTGVERKTYLGLCSKHNDISYNKTVSYVVGPDSDISDLNKNFMDTDFIGVEITSDSDYDATHPVGTSLGDVTMFCACSPKPYIDSGYKTLYVEDSLARALKAACGIYYAEGCPELHFIGKHTSDLTPDDLTLLGSGLIGFTTPFASILFTSRPTLSQTHCFTVKMTTDDGRQLSSSIDYEFGL